MGKYGDKIRDKVDQVKDEWRASSEEFERNAKRWDAEKVARKKK